jgi:hypothetical protein
MPGLERYSEQEMDPILRSVCHQWIAKIRLAETHKKEVFGNFAEECSQFYNGPRSWGEIMTGAGGYGISGSGLDGAFPEPDFQVSVNKVFEFVTIFGPALYEENPTRTVKPRMPAVIPWDFFPSPELWEVLMQQEQLRVRVDGLRSVLLETYLNWTPFEFKLDRHARSSIDEALIKGRGCLWTELYQPPGANYRVVRSTWESVDDLVIDPDATSYEKAQWIARRRIMPTWQVERDYGLRKGSIRGNMESQAQQSLALSSSEMAYDRKKGISNDLLVFYQVWSKMGIGGRLWNQSPSIRAACEPFGDYCYIVVAESIPFPLNCPPDVYNEAEFVADPGEVFARFAWPIPTWYEDRWPCAQLDFHQQHNCAWPMAHMRAAMGELKFLNWVNSFVMGKIRTTSRDFIAIKKEAGEEIRTTILEGKDLTLLELEAEHGTIAELVGFLQHPEMNGDIWKVIEAVEKNFDKRVGLTELMYGDSGETQVRSAAEINVKQQNMNVRPADMGRQVESWMSEVAANEALAARYHLRGNDVSNLLGAPGAYCWDLYVATLDLAEACRQLEYRIESGSTRRPNKDNEQQTVMQVSQLIMPVLQAYAQQTGDLGPLNNLLADIAKSRGLDPNRFMLRGLPALPAVPGESGQPEPGGTDVAQPADASPPNTPAPQGATQ